MLTRSSGDSELLPALSMRKWQVFQYPFKHVLALDAFTVPIWKSLEEELQHLLNKGLGDTPDPTRLSKNMQNSSAYGWDFPPDIEGPFSLFYRREWHDMLAGVLGVEASGDVNAAVHHHLPSCPHGFVHRDLGVGWFSDQPRPDGINPMDLRRCSYTKGRVSSPDIARREMARAVTMIYYFGNSNWKAGEGGETGLFQRGTDSIQSPAKRIPPLDNSLLIFENTPQSWHSFLQNEGRTRNSVILWLHRGMEQVVQTWGDVVSRW